MKYVTKMFHLLRSFRSEAISNKIISNKKGQIVLAFIKNNAKYGGYVQINRELFYICSDYFSIR